MGLFSRAKGNLRLITSGELFSSACARSRGWCIFPHGWCGLKYFGMWQTPAHPVHPNDYTSEGGVQ